MRVLVVAIAALGMSAAVAAAQNPPTLEEITKAGPGVIRSIPFPPDPSMKDTDSTRGGPPVFPDVPQGVQMDPATSAAHQEALREYFGYFKSGIAHRRQAFAWQLFSSRIIFWVVISLVAIGIYFAARQFALGLRAAGAPDAEATELTASLGGVRVRSPVLGVIILVISFAFFYLYLQFVYPMNTTF
jgi:hypothetical protein